MSSSSAEATGVLQEIIDEEAAVNFDVLFDVLPVKPCTLQQGSPEWFLLRKFSFTSSTSDRSLAQVKKLFIGRLPEDTLFIDPMIKLAIQRVLSVIHGPGWGNRSSTPSIPNPSNETATSQPDGIDLSSTTEEAAATPEDDDDIPAAAFDPLVLSTAPIGYLFLMTLPLLLKLQENYSVGSLQIL